MSNNLFELATRNRYRFASPKGNLTVEQLWDLPLNTGEVNLDVVAKTVNAKLKSVSEESFVQTNPNPLQSVLENKLEVVKHIISVLQAESEARVHARDRADKRRKLLSALASKEEQELTKMSKEDILKQLEALD